MERRKFIRTCCISAVALPIAAASFQSCSAVYYAKTENGENQLIVKKTEFFFVKKGKTEARTHVFVHAVGLAFPICLYKMNEDEYLALLMSCTHRGCELNFGGGIYSCPCHGSEFSIKGEVLEGPADKNLTSYHTKTDNENIYVLLS